MKYTKAVLVKKQSDDGMIVFHDNIPLGKEYMVDRDSVKFHHGLGRTAVRDILGGWLPVEVIQFTEEEDDTRTALDEGISPGE